MTDYQEQLTKNAIGHLMPELEEVGIPGLAKTAIKKCIWTLTRKLCELNVDTEKTHETEKNYNR